MVVMGLCVGHDSLFHQHAKAPCTTLAVKDYRSGHNPIFAFRTEEAGPCASACSQAVSFFRMSFGPKLLHSAVQHIYVYVALREFVWANKP